MKVFVAGATGALGRQLLPRLVAAGYDTVGMTRDPGKRELIESLGAEAAVADALDAAAVRRAVLAAEPDVVVHQLTALAAVDIRHWDRSFAVTNRLRTEGTDNLMAAALEAGASRFIAQSYAGWPAPRNGARVTTEEDGLDPSPIEPMRATHAAIARLERTVTEAEGIDGIVLRYGAFYGPGTSLSAEPGAEQSEAVRAGRFPVVGGGHGVWSFVHIADAATATVAAIERGRPGIYNVVDDEPGEVREWLPELAHRLGGPSPRSVPRLVGRVLAGETAVFMMTEVRGASNDKAKDELGWRPAYPSWRQGFAEGIG
jgi:nucleoside-diphosphate-sugar epimerase